MKLVALIPARGGSKRVPGKNMRLLGGKPLLAWTVEAARLSHLFDTIAICSDDERVYRWTCDPAHVSDELLFLDRPPVPDDQPDIDWVRHALHRIGLVRARPDVFAILRPTSPFRTPETIRRAVQRFQDVPCSSLRAVDRARQHPCKMWRLDGAYLEPYAGGGAWGDRAPYHSMPTQSLPEVYAQNSSLEIAWTWCVETFGTISGPRIAAFFTEGREGFAIDYPEDWERAEYHARALLAAL